MEPNPFSEPTPSTNLARLAAGGRTDDVLEALVHEAQKDVDDALRWAAQEGHVETVEALLPYTESQDFHDYALERAVGSGHVAVVRLLLPDAGSAARLAMLPHLVRRGWSDALSEAVEGLTPSPYANRGMALAAGLGRADMVRTLLPLYNVEQDQQAALLEGLSHERDGSAECIKILAAIGQPDPVAETLLAQEKIAQLDRLLPYLSEDYQIIMTRNPLLENFPNARALRHEMELDSQVASGEGSRMRM